MDEQTLARLRRTAVSTISCGVDVERFFAAARVRVVEQRTISDAVRWAQEHPWGTHVIEDLGMLDRALELVERLEAAAAETGAPPQRRPLVVVVSPSLERGLAELGWTRSTFRVGFARSANLAVDLDGALDELCAGEPELPPDVMDRERALGAADDAPAFDVDALVDALREAGAWAGAVVERVGGTVELHAELGDEEAHAGGILDARLVCAWADAAGTRFHVSFAAELPAASASFSAWSKRGLGGAFPGVLQNPTLGDARFDDAWQLRADEAGAAAARALKEVLQNMPASVDELAAHFERLSGRASRVARADLVAAAAWWLELWRVVARQRLVPPPAEATPPARTEI